MTETAVWMEIKLQLAPPAYRALEARAKPVSLSVAEYIHLLIARELQRAA